MTRRRRMIISVQPRLLADALSRVLARDDVEIVVRSEHDAPPGDHLEYDLAIVSTAPPADISAEVVIRLPEAGEVDDVPALTDLIGRVERVWAQVEP